MQDYNRWAGFGQKATFDVAPECVRKRTYNDRFITMALGGGRSRGADGSAKPQKTLLPVPPLNTPNSAGAGHVHQRAPQITLADQQCVGSIDVRDMAAPLQCRAP
jgi:hypothetical protein